MEGELTTEYLGAVSKTYRYDVFGRWVTKTMPGHVAAYDYKYKGKMKTMTALTLRNFPDEVDTGMSVSESFIYDERTLAGAYEYTPYGAAYTASGPTDYYQFAGLYHDTATDQYWTPYRWYDPEIARWTTPDPLGIVDGPNVYAYVGGRPINKIDPLGYFGIDLGNLSGCDDCACPPGTACQTDMSIYIGCLLEPLNLVDVALFMACVSGSGGIATPACLLLLGLQLSSAIGCLQKATRCK